MRSIMFKVCAGAALALLSAGAFASATYQYFEPGSTKVSTEIIARLPIYRTGLQSHYYKQGWKGQKLDGIVVGTVGYDSMEKYILLPFTIPSHGYMKVMAANYKIVNGYHEWEITVEDKSQSHALLWKGSYLCKRGIGEYRCEQLS